MLQVARLAPKLLSDSVDSVASFLRGQLNADGGFRDRGGKSDLYYTVFGIEGLIALRLDLPAAAIAAYLRTFGDGEHLDLVHLGCLARCWAGLPTSPRTAVPADKILQRIETHRSADGGYHAKTGSADGTLYGCFIAVGAYQDLGRPQPAPLRMLACLEALRADDGGYANQRDLPLGLTPSTAAAVALLRHLEQPLPAELGNWLLARCHVEGGFYATPMAPLPDLLSTATALHALSTLHVDFEPIRESCLDFIDTLWSNRGAFHGNWTDDDLDCEYTYYALLALGHLSL
jgi:hypothetical protein